MKFLYAKTSLKYGLKNLYADYVSHDLKLL